MKVIYASHFEPMPIGDGGNHRAYQIWHDLELAVGAGNIIPFRGRPHRWGPVPGSPLPSQRLIAKARRRLNRIRRRILEYLENPFKILADTIYSTSTCLTPDSLIRYETLVSQIHEPAVGVIEHSGFSDLIAINTRYGIPTIGCIQNLESLDMPVIKPERRWELYTIAVDFANEFRTFAQCAERLFISKVEVGLIGGLGLPSLYYPYLPVAAIRERLETLRQRRTQATIESGLFLMIGTAAHLTTRQSFTWFAKQAATQGLPKGVRVVVGGADTQHLLAPGEAPAGLELRGWLEQDELDELLTCAQAVLVPQQLGLGAITRLPEFALAGIPALVSNHPTYALDLPPGNLVVGDRWVDWCAALQEMSARSAIYISAEQYTAWEAQQPKVLSEVVRKLMPLT